MKFQFALLCALVCALLTGCTKQNDFETSKITASEESHLLRLPPTTTFGVLLSGQSITDVESTMTLNGIGLVRSTVVFSQSTSSKTIDTYLQDGYNVQI